MNLFTYLMSKKGKNSLSHNGDLFAYLLDKKETPILPEAYQQIDYIEGTGTQFINTGYKPSNYTKYDLTVKITEFINAITGIIGIYNLNSPLQRWTIYLSNTNNFSIGYGGNYYNSDVVPELNTKYHLIQDKNNFIVNNQTIKTYQAMQKTVSSLNACIFRRQPSDGNICKMKLYGCKIYEDTVIVRDFIPCIRKEDNKPGLYDIVNNEFYTNQGTDEFLIP